ncbi:MAG: hypothetical protein ABIJ20_00180 [Nanoarchaeota archaeon]|nr:hypothetical protein [Nanoarchaeota archaeon]MBU1445132.1 hypothetical protein [Nanoarchaeota archaeon]MBU2406897.1 hypothetical protein [Nanoarchaeota archaeon]MBU2420082.1 hypothetical protein [Nanoarchaeota archaeon]MBU2475559.1 hypothetical protein [Nanoarchaeota archaeon]
MNFLKNIFGKKEPDVEFVDLDELDAWLVNRVDILKNLKITIKECYDEVRTLMEETEKKLDVLSTVSVEEEQVPEKLKQIVKGNRDIYVQGCSILLRKLAPPVITDYKTAEEYIEKFKEEINSFNKKGARNFSIAQNLIGKELVSIVDSLKEMIFIVKNLKKRLEEDKPKLQEYEDVLTKIGGLRKDILSCRENENYQLMMVEEVSRLKEEQERIESKISKLKKSKDLLKLENDKVNLRDIEISKQNKFDKIIDLFSKVDKALKKYNNLNENELITAYLKSSTNALKQDRDLQIVETARKIKTMIDDRKLDISDDKRVRILEGLTKLDKDSLYGLRIAFIEAEKEEEVLRKRVLDNKILEDIKEEEMRLKEIKDEIKKEKNKEIEFVDLEKEKIEIQTDILRMTGTEVKIENEALD